MKLLSVRLCCPDTLGEFSLDFADESGSARPLTLIFGGPGSGKTTLVAAIGNTRPGHTVSLQLRAADPPCYAECAWALGIDEPDRAPPLVLQSPNTPEELRRLGPAERREAAFVERLAREGGFVCLSFSAQRWFSRNPLLLTALDRVAGRHELRVREPIDDATRHDLTRDVKQALAHAAIVRALPEPSGERHHQYGDAMQALVGALLGVGGVRYLGLEPRSLEPMFTRGGERRFGFDALPTCLKHAVALGALCLRALWSAYPGVDPRRAEALVVIDEIDLHQDVAAAAAILDVLVAHLPEVQWVATTRSTELIATRAEGEVLALRQLTAHGGISVHAGPDAQLH